MALSTVSGILTRIGMGKLGRLGLEPAPPLRARAARRAGPHRRQEARPHPGRRRQARHAAARSTTTRAAPIATAQRRDTVGWEFVHIAIDDCTRLAYAEVLADEKATTAIAFLRRAVAFFERHGIKVERLLTDNGSAYRSTMHAIACRALGIRHLRTRPYRPQTNGKAERFIRTLLGGWAYGAIYRTSPERTAALDGWLWHYNHQRTTLSPRPQAPDRSPRRANQPARDLHLRHAVRASTASAALAPPGCSSAQAFSAAARRV